jgi:hypothetical protein
MNARNDSFQIWKAISRAVDELVANCHNLKEPRRQKQVVVVLSLAAAAAAAAAA